MDLAVEMNFKSSMKPRLFFVSTDTAEHASKKRGCTLKRWFRKREERNLIGVSVGVG